MGKLIDHEFKTPIYVPPKEDIIDNLFTPAYSNSIRYDRCAGYFRSTIYDLTWQSMLSFIENDGKIRLTW